jgi:hypothetical protein
MPFDARPDTEVANDIGGTVVPRPITHRDIAIQARKYIANPRTWSFGTFARSAKGECTAIGSRDAVRFCAVGAIERSVFDLVGAKRRSNPEYYRVRGLSQNLQVEMDRLAHRMYGKTLIRLNDNIRCLLLLSSPRRRVLKVFDAWLAMSQKNYCSPGVEHAD